MNSRTPLGAGVLTDLALHQLAGATVEDRGTHLVVRSPHNPTYRWGNFIQILDGTVADRQRWERTFDETFPDAGHRTFGSAEPMDPADWPGYLCEVEETLATTSQPRRTPAPEGYEIREFVPGDWEEWAKHKAVELAEEEGRDPAGYREYAAGRAATLAGMAEQGYLYWLGAFADGDLAASLGIALCPEILGQQGLARYQVVGTRPEHRRHGLASHLLGEVGAWAAERGATTFVICTETTNPAGRIYRASGFEPAALSYGAELASR